jgi:hypothetical protein
MPGYFTQVAAAQRVADLRLAAESYSQGKSARAPHLQAERPEPRPGRIEWLRLHRRTTAA